MKRYHKEVFFEDNAEGEIKLLIDKMDLKPTKHFMDMWIKRGNVSIPTKVIIKQGVIFEYYRDKGKIIKFVVRCENLSDKHDVIYVITDDGGIVTSWINDKKNVHENLRRELYECGTGDILSSERKNTTKRSKEGSRCENLIKEWKRKKYSASSKTSWNR